MLSRGRWQVFAAALLGAALTARLGVWQLDRAAQKLALQAAIDAQAQCPTLGNAELAGNPLHRRVALRGSWAAVQTAASVDDGLLRHWPPPELGLHKHYGYAFQWFALCALILVLYVWFQLIRPRLRHQQQS